MNTLNYRIPRLSETDNEVMLSNFTSLCPLLVGRVIGRKEDCSGTEYDIVDNRAKVITMICRNNLMRDIYFLDSKPIEKIITGDADSYYKFLLVKDTRANREIMDNLDLDNAVYIGMVSNCKSSLVDKKKVNVMIVPTSTDIFGNSIRS